MLNTYSVPCFVIYSENKRLSHHSVNTLTSKNTSGILLVFSLSINTFFLPFSGILPCNYMNQHYPVAVYVLNSTPYSLFLIAANVSLIFHAVRSPSKHQPCLSSHLEISKYVRRYFVCCLFPSKYVISPVLQHFYL